MALENVLKDVIEENDRVLVGVSGGADSMCLLDLVYKFSKKCKFSFYAVHINHNLRDKEALRDEEFVRNFCENKEISFIKESINTLEYAKEHNKTVEQAGRELRYKTFEKLLKEYDANKLLIAHHKDDQAETVLMHIARGSSLKGAKGIQKRSDYIYRPLLNFTRTEIEEYNKQNNINFVLDSSNKELKYTRNYIRNVIIPKLKEIYPNIVGSLCSFAEKCEKDEDFIDKQVKKYLVSEKKGLVYIDVSGLKDDYTLASRLVRYAIEKLDVFADIEQKHIKEIINLANKENGKFINLTNALNAYKEYSHVVIKKEAAEEAFSPIPFGFGDFTFGDQGTFVVDFVKQSDGMAVDEGCLFLDANKIPHDAVFRTRKAGDKFKKFGSGTKKLNDYFTDIKIPKRSRDFVPILASGSNVLCVLGKEISEDVKTTKATKMTVKITQKS